MTDGLSALFAFGCFGVLVGLSMLGLWLGGSVLGIAIFLIVGGAMLAAGAALVHLNRRGAAAPGSDVDGAA